MMVIMIVIMEYDEDQLDDGGDEQVDVYNDSYVVDVVKMMMIMDYDQDQLDDDGVKSDNDVSGLMMMLVLILPMMLRIEMIVDNYDEISIFYVDNR